MFKNSMKIKNLIITGFGLLGLCFILSSGINYSRSGNERTEEYAMVEVFEYKSRQTIRIIKGENPVKELTQKEEKEEQTDDIYDKPSKSKSTKMSVFKVLGELNAEGYEIVNASIAYETVSQGGGSYPVKVYGGTSQTFMMRKKLR